jgi:kynureninase
VVRPGVGVVHDGGMDRAVAERLDAADPLAAFRDEFVITDDDLVYLDGNSLGRLPKRVVERLARAVVDDWGTGLIRSWSEWIDLPERVGDRLGRAVLGAGTGQVVLADSTTVNLFKLAAAALDARPGRSTIVCDPGDFPTDRYVLAGLAQARGLRIRSVERPDEVERALDGDVALVMFSVVDYRSGAIADAATVTAAAHAAGALTVWDLSHAAGVLDVRLDDWQVDLAAGCTYKYLNAGPGAPAWLYVRRALQDHLVPPVWGWFGQRDQFAMGARFQPAAGIRRWLSGTPAVLGLVAVDAAVSLLEEAGIERVRAKGVALTSFATDLAERWLAPLGFALGSPTDATRRGSQLALRHPEAFRLSRALIEEASTIPDYRAPDVLRIGLSPLTTRFREVWDGFDRLRRLVEDRAWERYDPTPGAVT